MVACSLALIKEAAGATIESVSAQGIQISIGRPEILNIALYLAIVYLLFRFWQLAKGSSLRHGQVANRYLNKCQLVQSLAKGALTDKMELYQNEPNPSIARGIFKRNINVSVALDGRGEVLKPIPAPYLKLLPHEFVADIRSITLGKDFVEYTFPLILANFTLTVKYFLLLQHWFLP